MASEMQTSPKKTVTFSPDTKGSSPPPAPIPPPSQQKVMQEQLKTVSIATPSPIGAITKEKPKGPTLIGGTTAMQARGKGRGGRGRQTDKTKNTAQKDSEEWSPIRAKNLTYENAYDDPANWFWDEKQSQWFFWEDDSWADKAQGDTWADSAFMTPDAKKENEVKVKDDIKSEDEEKEDCMANDKDAWSEHKRQKAAATGVYIERGSSSRSSQETAEPNEEIWEPIDTSGKELPTIPGLTKKFEACSFSEIWEQYGRKKESPPSHTATQVAIQKVREKEELFEVAYALDLLDQSLSEVKATQQRTLKQQLFVMARTIDKDRRDVANHMVVTGWFKFKLAKDNETKCMHQMERHEEHKANNIQRLIKEVKLPKKYEPQVQDHSVIRQFGEISAITVTDCKAPWIRNRICKYFKTQYGKEGFQEKFEVCKQDDLGLRLGRDLERQNIKSKKFDGKLFFAPQLCLFDRLRGIPLKIGMAIMDELFSHVPPFQPEWKTDEVVAKSTGEKLLVCLFDPREAICELWLNPNIDMKIFQPAFAEAIMICDLARASPMPQKKPLRTAHGQIHYSKYGSFPWTMHFNIMPSKGFEHVQQKFAKHVAEDDSDLD